MRNVGDKIAPRPFQTANFSYIVKDHHRTSYRVPGANWRSCHGITACSYGSKDNLSPDDLSSQQRVLKQSNHIRIVNQLDSGTSLMVGFRNAKRPEKCAVAENDLLS